LSPQPCVLDASLLISLGKVGRLDLLEKAPSFSWYITPLTRNELRRPETREPVERLILEGRITVAELDSEDAAGMALLADWSERVDPGEAESTTVALARQWVIGLEDLQARRLLDRHAGPGRWINCATILLDAVGAGSLPLPAAEEVFQTLDVYTSYLKAGIRSLAQLRR